MRYVGLDQIMDSDYLTTIDSAERDRVAQLEYDGVAADHYVNRMIASDFRFTLADNDLPKVAQMCQRAGVEPRFPLLSDASCNAPWRYA